MYILRDYALNWLSYEWRISRKWVYLGHSSLKSSGSSHATGPGLWTMQNNRCWQSFVQRTSSRCKPGGPLVHFRTWDMLALDDRWLLPWIASCMLYMLVVYIPLTSCTHRKHLCSYSCAWGIAVIYFLGYFLAPPWVPQEIYHCLNCWPDYTLHQTYNMA